jgi:hypothetical protein
MNGDDAACGPFDKLRGAVGQLDKGICGLDHGKTSGGLSCVTGIWHLPNYAATGQMAGLIHFRTICVNLR